MFSLSMFDGGLGDFIASGPKVEGKKGVVIRLQGSIAPSLLLYSTEVPQLKQWLSAWSIVGINEISQGVPAGGVKTWQIFANVADTETDASIIQKIQTDLTGKVTISLVRLDQVQENTFAAGSAPAAAASGGGLMDSLGDAIGGVNPLLLLGGAAVILIMISKK